MVIGDTPFWTPGVDADLPRETLEELRRHLLAAADDIERLLGCSPRTAELRQAYRANRPGGWRGNGSDANAT